ncbi:ribonuclease H-like domain-containing protein [Rhodocollybia butyracea]|uniref:Ribonuclease H-like domain-containing protein n=1 Tax=Rhodocollybia butyracea TaxID=206335 RepID=A0A9P5U8Y5_9AGAR|nr:ribonuclease H-like domain-containing protein [Rhodocollybia butyracea]
MPSSQWHSDANVSSWLERLGISNSASSTTPWVLCNSDGSLEDVLTNTLSNCTVIALDCEGDKLGRKGGTLSLISLRPLAPKSSTGTTSLIDVLAFPKESSILKRLFSIIESESIQKIVFDGRMDYCAFFYEYGVQMRNVLDMQLADIQSRAARGQSAKTQNQRLFGYLPPNEVSQNRTMYSNVHRLGALSSCLMDHDIDVSPKDIVDHQAWLVRPIEEKHLGYAAHDVELIESVYTVFKRRGFINRSLSEQSQRYITLWSDIQPSDNDVDVFRSHPLLPLDILVQGSPQDTTCGGCRRKLSQGCFPHFQWELFCYVCLAVQAKNRSDSVDSRGTGGRRTPGAKKNRKRKNRRGVQYNDSENEEYDGSSYPSIDLFVDDYLDAGWF